MFSTPLKNISQIGSFPQVGMKINTYLKPPPREAILSKAQKSDEHRQHKPNEKTHFFVAVGWDPNVSWRNTPGIIHNSVVGWSSGGAGGGNISSPPPPQNSIHSWNQKFAQLKSGKSSEPTLPHFCGFHVYLQWWTYIWTYPRAPQLFTT